MALGGVLITDHTAQMNGPAPSHAAVAFMGYIDALSTLIAAEGRGRSPWAGAA